MRTPITPGRHTHHDHIRPVSHLNLIWLIRIGFGLHHQIFDNLNVAFQGCNQKRSAPILMGYHLTNIKNTYVSCYGNQRRAQEGRSFVHSNTCTCSHIHSHYTPIKNVWISIYITTKHTCIAPAPDSPGDAQRLVPRLRGSGSAPSPHTSGWTHVRGSEHLSPK